MSALLCPFSQLPSSDLHSTSQARDKAEGGNDAENSSGGVQALIIGWPTFLTIVYAHMFAPAFTPNGPLPLSFQFPAAFWFAKFGVHIEFLGQM